MYSTSVYICELIPPGFITVSVSEVEEHIYVCTKLAASTNPEGENRLQTVGDVGWVGAEAVGDVCQIMKQTRS